MVEIPSRQNQIVRVHVREIVFVEKPVENSTESIFVLIFSKFFVRDSIFLCRDMLLNI